MGKPKRLDTPGVDIRVEVLAKYRALDARTRRRLPDAAGSGFFLSPWPRLIRQLEAGDPVRFPTWRLPKSVRDLLPPAGMDDWYELGADGSLTPTDGPFRSEPGDG